MTTRYEIEERVIVRAMAPFPLIPQLVAGSTPVVSFGYPKSAKVATLGINPSSNEFLVGNGDKNPLAGQNKRLVDAEVLGNLKITSLDRQQALKVIQGCFSYFENNPYEWFDALQEYALNPVGASFKNGTACHLDLVQWATDPVWQDPKMPKEIKSLLLNDDKDFLEYQLTHYNFSHVFLNGSTVLNQVEKLNLVRLEKVGEVRFNQSGTKSKIVTGQLGSKRFIGWGINVGYGASYKPGLEDLAQWLKTNLGNIK